MRGETEIDQLRYRLELMRISRDKARSDRDYAELVGSELAGTLGRIKDIERHHVDHHAGGFYKDAHGEWVYWGDLVTILENREG